MARLCGCFCCSAMLPWMHIQPNMNQSSRNLASISHIQVAATTIANATSILTTQLNLSNGTYVRTAYTYLEHLAKSAVTRPGDAKHKHVALWPAY